MKLKWRVRQRAESAAGIVWGIIALGGVLLWLYYAFWSALLNYPGVAPGGS